jgi:hypothetical protein
MTKLVAYKTRLTLADGSVHNGRIVAVDAKTARQQLASWLGGRPGRIRIWRERNPRSMSWDADGRPTCKSCQRHYGWIDHDWAYWHNHITAYHRGRHVYGREEWPYDE